MPTTMASSDMRSRVYMTVKVRHTSAASQSAFTRGGGAVGLKAVSEQSYIAAKLAMARQDRQNERGPPVGGPPGDLRSRYCFGADEELSEPEDFDDFLWLWCFLWLLLFAGADALLSDAGGVVSAASTGPARNNRLRTGTIFLNIESLQGELSDDTVATLLDTHCQCRL